MALRIRRRRTARGMAMKDAAKALGVTSAYWSAVENSRTVLSDQRAAEMFDLLEFDQGEREILWGLLRVAKIRPWWADHDFLTDDARHFFGLELEATRIRSYESSAVPGLFQTDRYASEIIGSYPGTAPSTVSRRVEVRKRRQEILWSETPPTVTVVMSESIIHQIMGSAGVLIEQLRHLVYLARSLAGSVELRISPFAVSAGAVAGASTLVLLSFDDHELLPTVSLLESLQSSSVRGPEDTELLELCFGQALERSLDPEGSLELIERQIEKLEAAEGE